MYAEAEAELQKAQSLSNGGSGRTELGILYATWGKRREAFEILSRIKSAAHPDAYSAALLCVATGDKEQAFGWLDKAYREHSSFHNVTLKVEPVLDPLRSDARFNNLLRRIGLPL